MLDFLFIRLVPMNLMDLIFINISKQPLSRNAGKYTRPTASSHILLDSKSGNIFYKKEAGFCYGNRVS